MHRINWFPANHQAGLSSSDAALLPLSCINGWQLHSRRLTDRISAINRYAGPDNGLVIGIAPMLNGTYCLVAFVAPALDTAATQMLDAIEQFRSKCLSTCSVCGKPARALVAGGVLCPAHEHPQFRHEAVFDPRQIARMRRIWMVETGAKITGRMMKHSHWPAIPVYDLAGARYVRAHDAPPGQRQTFFESLVDEGLRPEELGKCWVFRISGAQHD